MSEGDGTTVLIVDDQPNVARAYEMYLSDEYAVITATGGEEALEKLDETVDIALLDRRMPDLTGDEVLERIRDHGYSCRVAMVTAVEPDFDILEMEFDTYLTKPVTESEIRETVEQLSRVQSLEETMQERFSLAQKRATLETEKTESELAESEEYAEVVERFEELNDYGDYAAADMGGEEFSSLLRDFDTGEPDPEL